LPNGAGNFRRDLVDTSKLKTSAPTSRHDINELVDDLDKNQLSD
jgi:hypothetical protein